MAGTRVALRSDHSAPTVGLMPVTVGVMDEEEIARQLHDPSFDRRTDILEQLRAASRRNAGRLPFTNKAAIFEAVGQTLADSNWHVRNQSIQLLHELVPQFGDELDDCMRLVVNRLVGCVGDSNVSIRRAAIQTLHVYMKHTRDVSSVLQAVVVHGLENTEPRVRKEVTIALPVLCTPDFGRADFFHVTQALAKRLLDSGDQQSHALLSLKKIRGLVGEQVFNSYVHRLSPPMRRFYFKLTDHSEDVDFNGHHMHQNNASSSASNFEFGVVPSHVMDKLSDQSNFRTRAQAVEELKQTIRDLQEPSHLAPHVPAFIQFLTNLLDDSNFKITTVTLEILGLLVQRLGRGMEPHLKGMTTALAKRMGDNKIVVRQAIMKDVMQLMQALSPRTTLAAILDNLAHRNSRVRQETLNICIASLLTFPSYDFDLGEICKRIAHTLVDPKRQVRQASLECFAYLAQTMGPGKMQPLVQAVDSVELSCEGDGVMGAVQARLARRQLPRLSVDGLVDYAILIPSSASSARGTSTPQGADLDWILSASGGSGSSARSSRNEVMELESVTSSARSTPVHHDNSHGPSPRRHLSAGKARNRLPWEEATEQHNGAGNNGQPPPSKAKGLWAQEEAESSPSRKPRNHQKAQAAHIPRDPSPPDQGSYLQIHMSKSNSKYKRSASSDITVSQPFTTYNNSDRRSESGADGWNYPASLANTPRNSTHAADVKMFSQSWSEPQMFEDAGKPNKRIFLDPISVADGAPSGDWMESDDRKASNKVDSSPIPTKPTLARGASSKKKVPPISGSRSDKSPTSDFHQEVAASVETTREEMDIGLKSIRSSANKKKANVKPDTRSPSPESETGESSMRSEDSKSKSKKSDAPFETKPRLVRKPSQRSEGPPSLSSPSMPQMDFQPRGGVTFTQNRSSDVAIVGKGYGDESQQSDPRPSQHAMRAKDRRRLNSKGVLSPLTMANPYAHGALEMDDERFPDAVIGRRMFDPSSYGATGQPTDPAFNRNRRASRDANEGNLPRGVYGHSVRQNSLEKSSEDDDFSDDEEAISMAPTTKEALNRKRQELSRKREEEAAEQKRKAEAAEKRRQEVERKRLEAEQRRQKEAELRQIKEEELRQQEEELKQKERERQQDKLKRLTSSQVDPPAGIEGTLAISGNSSQPLNNTAQPRNINSRPANNTKKRNHVPVSMATEKPSPSNEETESEPFKDPQRAFDESMKLMSNEQWDVKCSGIENIRRLALHHPEVLAQPQQLHTLNLALINEVKNLRSQVSRLAIIALGDIYSKLGRAAETDLEQTAKGLVGKYAESNSFIHEELDKTFRNMVDHLTPQRCMSALINGGASHKSGHVRRATSQFLVPIVERMGPGRVLSGIKEVTDKILPAAVNFLLDGSPETRYNGQCILAMLMNHDDFDRMITKHVPANTLRNGQDKLDNLKKKGLGDPPSEPGSAKTHRSGRERSNNSIRGNSASSTASGSNSVQSAPAVHPPSITKRPSAMRTDEATMENIAAFCQKMKANNWQERQAGINDMVSMTESRPNAVWNNITKIFDAFIPCLKDSNSKTNLHALQMMIRLTPALNEHLGSVVNMLVQNLSANLSSKNKDIYETASQALDELMEHIDAQQLIQPMVQQAQSGSARIKPDMVERVAFLTHTLGQKGGRLKTIRMHSLPLMWHLINTVPTSGTVPGLSGNLRVAVSGLASALYTTLGEELFKASKDQSKVTPRMLQVLQEMIDNPE